MNSLNEIIGKHFSQGRKDEIISIINDYGFEEILINAYNNLIELKSSNNGICLINSPSFSTTIISIIYDINEGLIPVKEEKKKEIIKKAISELSLRIIFDFIRELEVDFKEAIQAINKVALSSPIIYKYVFDDFNKYFNSKELASFLMVNSDTDFNHNLKKKKNNTITWLAGQRSKEELVHLINKKRTWIRKQNHLFQLFENPAIDLKVFWNSEYYEELAFLIYSLHKNSMIGCTGNRGCFSAVEIHLFDFDDNKIKKGTLKKLSYRINKNWNKYEHRMSSVASIIKAVQKKAHN